MFVKFSELQCGDLVRASWLGTYKGSEWHFVYEIYNLSDDKININIEGYGNLEVSKDDTIEKK